MVNNVFLAVSSIATRTGEVTLLMVTNIVAGPGGKTRPLGGVVNVSSVLSLDSEASMNTRRALEWNAWLENPRSINATNHDGKSARGLMEQMNLPDLAMHQSSSQE